MHTMHVILATDGSVHALKAAAWLDDMATHCPCRVSLVSVAGAGSFDSETHGLEFDESWRESTSLNDAWDRARVHALNALHQTQEAIHHAEIVGTEVLAGSHTGTAIIDYARQHHADLIVVGRRGRSSLGTLLGSVSFSIVQQSTIPVTVVGSFPLWDDSVLASSEGKL